jgi:hypothetical protein
VYLPKDVADQRCDIFNNQHPGINPCSGTIFEHIPYPETIGDMQYVIGRDVLIQLSGMSALTDTCKNIRVFTLPWFDGKSNPDGRRFWTPRLNNMFMKCAAEGQGAKPSKTLYTIRMVLSVVDMNHILHGHEFPSDVEVNGRTLPVSRVSILAPGPSKTVIELCQLCFNYSSPKDPLRLMAEVKPSHKAMYTCFWLPGTLCKKLLEKNFKDITEMFMLRLLGRLEKDDYKVPEIVGRYYPDEEGEGF